MSLSKIESAISVLQLTESHQIIHFCSLQVEYEVKWIHVTTLHSMADPFILTKDIAPKIIISSGLSLTMLWFVVFLLHILQPVIPPSFLLSFHLSLLLSSLPSRTFWVRCSVLLGKLLDHQPVDWRNRWGEFQLFSHFSTALLPLSPNVIEEYNTLLRILVVWLHL